ncbi:MAG: hypothetical protein CMJ78_14650 [Planctomycetaceae bacterium]|nr:hypothetical protein [Planctomycetaceae bacterium]
MLAWASGQTLGVFEAFYCPHSLPTNAANKRRRRVSASSAIEALEERALLATFQLSAELLDDEDGGLRQAISEANSNGEDDEITLQEGVYSLSIRNSKKPENANLEGDFDLTEAGQSIVITGQGASRTIIDGEGIDRLFHVFEGVNVTLRDLTLTGGVARDNGVLIKPARGGAILNAGGDLTLDNVFIIFNKAVGRDGRSDGTGDRGGRGFGVEGGGLYSLGGSLTVTDSVIQSNRAIAGDGGDGGSTDAGGFGGDAFGGGAFIVDSQTEITDSAITNNRLLAGKGGQAGFASRHGRRSNFGGVGGNASGGGLYISAADAELSDIIVNNNLVRGGNGRGGTGGGDGGTASGGGLFHAAETLTINGGLIEDNLARGGDGSGGFSRTHGGDGGVAMGGGIGSAGTLEINEASILDNIAKGGRGGAGGVGVYRGSAAFFNGGDGGNGGDGHGGGLGASGILTVTNTLFADNQALGNRGGQKGPGALERGGRSTRPGDPGDLGKGHGGGLHTELESGRLRNTTVSDNRSDHEGGGIWNNGRLNIFSSTITVNIADIGSGVVSGESATTLLQNSIVAANSGAADLEGSFRPVSLANVIGNVGSATGLVDGENSNHVGSAEAPIDPRLRPLADNGGPTLTHLPRQSSPAVNAADPETSEAFDQRGTMRSANGLPDIGAVERQLNPNVEFAVPELGEPAILSIFIDGDDLVIRDSPFSRRAAGGEVSEFLRRPFDTVGRLNITGTSGNDSIFVSLARTPIQSSWLRFDGGDGDDVLTIFSLGPSTPELTQHYRDSSTRVIDIDGSLIRYSNVERVEDFDTPRERTFRLSAGDDSATLSKEGFDDFAVFNIDGEPTFALTMPIDRLGIDAQAGDDNITVDVKPSTLGRFVIDTREVVVIAGDGDDVIDGSGSQQSLFLNGGAGDDLLIGGISADLLAGAHGDDTLEGRSGNDHLFAGHGNDILLADGGQDLLYADHGDNQLDGGIGSDVFYIDTHPSRLTTVTGRAGNDRILATGDGDVVVTESELLGWGVEFSGIDAASLTGGASANRIDASSANFPVRLSGGGKDELIGGNFNDTLHGGTGSDVILAGDGDDLIFGANGNDEIRAGSGNDRVLGGAGNDRLIGNGGDDQLHGGLGNDILLAGGGNDLVSAGEGADFVNGQGGEDQLHGDSGRDTIVGGPGNDVIDGGDGTDLVADSGFSSLVLTDVRARGADSDDSLTNIERAQYTGTDGPDRLDTSAFRGESTVIGGDGDDTLVTGNAADRLEGGPGNDVLRSNRGDDVLIGGPGNDLLRAGLGDDFANGQAGMDTVDGREGDDILLGGRDDDTILGGNGVDTVAVANASRVLLSDVRLDAGDVDSLTDIEVADITGTPGSDLIDLRDFSGNATVASGEGNDNLTGGSGVNRFLAGPGNDRLRGGSQHDHLDGGEGDDTFVVSNGNDTLRGAAGNDLLRFRGDNVSLEHESMRFSTVVAEEQVEFMQVHSLIESAHLIGSAGNDVLQADGYRGDVLIEGLDGDNTLVGGFGRDTIISGEGNDDVNGRHGNDSISTGAGNDTIRGDIGNDTILSGAGNDSIQAQDGADLINAGSGADFIDTGSGNDIALGGGGRDTIRASRGNDTMHGGPGPDTFSDLFGINRICRDDTDTIFGSTEGDVIMNDCDVALLLEAFN